MFEARRLVAYALILLILVFLSFAEFKRRGHNRKKRGPSWRKRRKF